MLCLAEHTEHVQPGNEGGRGCSFFSLAGGSVESVGVCFVREEVGYVEPRACREVDPRWSMYSPLALTVRALSATERT